MPRLHSFFLTEMPRPKSDAILSVLDWAAQQKQPFTVKDLYKVYVTNGGRADSVSDNIQSFSTQIMKYVAKPWKDDQEKYGLSPKRPLTFAKRGSRGAGNPHLLQWGLDKPLRDPGLAKFVNPSDEEEGAGEAMDRLEAMMGPEKLKAAMARWQKLPNLNAVVADIKGTVPRKGQMDALHVASDFMMDQGKADPGDVDAAEDDVAPAPQAGPDDDEDYGEFSDAPMFDPDEFGDDEEESPATAPKPSPRKPPTKPAPEPEPMELEPDEDDVEEPTAQQAGAANFIKPSAPPAPAAPAKKSSVGALMKKFKK